MYHKIWMKGIVFGILLLFFGFSIMPMVSIVKADDPVWDVTLTFTTLAGQFDFVVFGEASDANDGPPVDSYDVVKPPPPPSPYIRAWFDDSLPYPYKYLLKDYRSYPDTYKLWNLTTHWENSTGTTVTITWNSSSVAFSEYDTVILWRKGQINSTWYPVADMLVDSSFSWVHEYLPPNPPYPEIWFKTDDFRIECICDEFTLDLTTSGIGNGTIEASPAGPYYYGAVVTVWANASVGSTFTGFSGDLTGIVSPQELTITENKTVNAQFTLQSGDPPIFGEPSPLNGSTGNPLSLTWSIPVNDSEGDSFNWWIQCSNGQSNNGTDSSNGTKTLALSGLAYVTTYTVWVNATDPYGSGNYTRVWYTFTTQAQPMPPPGGGPGAPLNQAPVADVSAGEPYQGFVGEIIVFNGSKSYDPDGSIVSWYWTFGDGANDTGAVVSHVYTSTGTFSVTLTVTDDEGASNAVVTTAVIMMPNLPPTSLTIAGPSSGEINIGYFFTLQATDPEGGMLVYLVDWGDGTSTLTDEFPSDSGVVVNHSWVSAGVYELYVVVRDEQNASAVASHRILINVEYVGDIGYLIDEDSDGTYDVFFSNSTGSMTSVELQVDGTYFIDSDGDGLWDYIYDSQTKILTIYPTEDLVENDMTVLIVGVILGIIVVIFILIMLLIYRKKQK